MSSRQRNTILLAVVLTVLGVSIAYNVHSSRKDASLEPERLTPFETKVTWGCLECGHTQSDTGANGPRKCPKCGKDAMYVVETWGCVTHRVMTVAFKYDAKGKPIQVKVGDGPWVSALDEEGDVNLRCPKCGDSLVPPQGLPPG